MESLQSLGNIIIRCGAVYIFVVLAIRLFGKKELAQLSVLDLVFILLISNSVQNAMVGPSTSLFGGLTAAAALFLINFLLKRLLYKNKKINILLQGHPVMLIHNGHLMTHNLEKEQISIDELKAAIREHGVTNVEAVDLAVLEVDGNISILSNNYSHRSKHRKIHKSLMSNP